MLEDGRAQGRLTQAECAARAGISRGRWADLEAGRDAGGTIRTYGRAAAAIGSTFAAYLTASSAADQPRDAVHLRHQELVIRIGAAGEWRALPEEMIDRDARTSRAADVLLTRVAPDGVSEYCLWDIRDWLDDVGAAVRDFTRRLEAVERYAIARMTGADRLPRTGGCMVLRATRRNRELVAAHEGFFRARFPGSGRGWLRALEEPPTSGQASLPGQPALTWVSVSGERLFPVRFGARRDIHSRA